jgi:major type 1 subunit fimbrin (pilin)
MQIAAPIPVGLSSGSVSSKSILGIVEMKKVAIAALVATAGLVAGAAHADSTSVNFTGQVTGATCNINGNGQGTNNFTVQLPTLSASALSAAGSSAGSTGFTIALTGCTPATGNVRTYWQGANALSDGNLLNNGTAAKVEVQLVDYNSGMHVINTSQPDGSQNSYAVPLSSGGNANLKYAAQYASPAGGAGAGTVATNVTYSLVYQ